MATLTVITLLTVLILNIILIFWPVTLVITFWLICMLTCYYTFILKFYSWIFFKSVTFVQYRAKKYDKWKKTYTRTGTSNQGCAIFIWVLRWSPILVMDRLTSQKLTNHRNEIYKMCIIFSNNLLIHNRDITHIRFQPRSIAIGNVNWQCCLPRKYYFSYKFTFPPL